MHILHSLSTLRHTSKKTHEREQDELKCILSVE